MSLAVECKVEGERFGRELPCSFQLPFPFVLCRVVPMGKGKSGKGGPFLDLNIIKIPPQSKVPCLIDRISAVCNSSILLSQESV